MSGGHNVINRKIYLTDMITTPPSTRRVALMKNNGYPNKTHALKGINVFIFQKQCNVFDLFASI